MNAAPKPVTYSMQKGARPRCRASECCLILDFPLKVIRIHPRWEPVLHLLSGKTTAGLDEIASLMSPLPGDKVEAYLQDLVRKGFLRQEGAPVLPEYPMVSVIIPVRNRPAEIRECILSLLRLEYPRDRLEIIVVDDASSDDTPEAVAALPVRLVRLREHRQASFCRNVGAGEAEGEILAFLDSDCVAGPLWLLELIPAFREPSVGIVGGMVSSFSTEKGLDRYEKVKSSLIVSAWFKRSSEDENHFYVPSCNMLVRKHLFAKLGGFRNDLVVGEDVDLCWRAQNEEAVVEYRPAGTIQHRHRNQWTGFCTRRFQYGTSEPLLQQLHEDRRKIFLLPPWACLFWALVLPGMALWSPALLLMSVGGLAADAISTCRKLADTIPWLSGTGLALARLRGYLAFFYHWCAFVSRYHLLWGLAVLPIFPRVAGIVIAMHLLTAAVEYVVRRPDLHALQFLIYFTVEQLSYQLGVWYGCIKSRHFRPVLPALRFSTSRLRRA